MLPKEVKCEYPTRGEIDLPKECSMSNSLCVRGQFVVFFVRHVDITRLKRFQDVLDQLKRFV
jgi:hypothetical protein